MKRSLPRPDYKLLSREQLIHRIEELEGRKQKTKKERKSRPFDFKAYPSQQVALKVAYFGWNYKGFASQLSYKPDSDEKNDEKLALGVTTVEDVLFAALLRARLIESPRTCNYSRCGRTDTNVSSTGQIISLKVRSSTRKDPNHTDFDIGICTLLNRMLPEDIRILGWRAVPESFNARFDCIGRKYRYFFSGIGLNMAKVVVAAEKLVGEHDFRHLCRKDASKIVTNFTRTIFSSKIVPRKDGMFELRLHGSAFLYHQVRCIMEVLFLIGRDEKPEEFMDYLLDVNNLEKPTPNYGIADGIPLVLSECVYPKELEIHSKMQEVEEPRDGPLFKLWCGFKVKMMIVNILNRKPLQRFEWFGDGCMYRVSRPRLN